MDRLRRCQALATFFSQGVDVARYLLTTKVEGQLKVLGKVPRAAEAREVITAILREMRDADSLGDLRHMESRAAASYWDALRDLPVRFVGRDAAKVPIHWNTVGSRGSVLTESPRKAVTPAHALLNYLYAVLEAEARIASLAMGCDPGLGVIHTDSGQRDSFACDLMEAVRPVVDDYVLHLLAVKRTKRSQQSGIGISIAPLGPAWPRLSAQRVWATGRCGRGGRRRGDERAGNALRLGGVARGPWRRAAFVIGWRVSRRLLETSYSQLNGCVSALAMSGGSERSRALSSSPGSLELLGKDGALCE
jgi:hypothetical protein